MSFKVGANQLLAPGFIFCQSSVSLSCLQICYPLDLSRFRGQWQKFLRGFCQAYSPCTHITSWLLHLGVFIILCPA